MSLCSHPTPFVGLGSCADAQILLSGWLGIAGNSDKLLEAPAAKVFSISSSAVGDQNENENQADEDTIAVPPPAAEEVPDAA